MVFKECNDFLQQKKNEGNSYITELFCIGYIKSFCYTFINMHKKKKFNPENIIKIINESDKMNLVKLYIYKIIYNKNNRQINVFLNSEIIHKYKLENYKGFNEFINKEEIEKLEHFNYANSKSKIFKKLSEYGEKKFEEKISKDDICLKKKEFDEFFLSANKLILSKLNNENFENDISYTNFYKNVCEPLFMKDEGENKLISLLKFIFEKDSYIDIKKEYKINSEDIEQLLYGYRYCLNEVNLKEGNYIYSYLYNRSNLSDFDQKFYPGNDNNKDAPYYELYNKIINHFKENPDEGCFVCLCDKGFYHCVPSGFPGIKETNMKCPKCKNEIGAKEFYIKEKDENDPNKEMLIKKYETTENNTNYYRIFKDNEQIKDLKRMKDYFSKFERLKYMTVEEFKERYIRPLYRKEKGLNKIDINNFKKDNKITRNLSQISYRLLNYILYCQLFFAKLYTQSEKFDNYLPDGMSWITMIKECFTKLKVELENKGIKNLEIFMNSIFKDLFEKLHYQECIDNFEDLIKFEDELEKLIQEKCVKAIEEIDNFKKLERDSIKDEKSAIALIKEIYDKSKYEKNKDFRFYKYFYYTDYLDENYINNILKGRDEDKYPLLTRYLKYKMQEIYEEEDDIEDKYSLDNLNLFNKGLKLFNDKYSNQISRNLAERQTIKESDIYKEEKNVKLIKEFIELYNDFEIQDDEGNKLKLNKEKNFIIDFLLIDDNKYGKSYKKIYKEFIYRQNKELECLLDIKINSGEFNANCKNKINIQQIKENEIFSMTKKFSFTNVIFNSSYRKYIDTQKHENYNEYVIRFKQVESEITNSLLKNKKLVNDNLTVFNFNNEVFSYEITDLITNFEYENIPINIDDKEVIYRFIKDNDGNNDKYKIIINNFITLIEYLNKESKNQNDKINANTKICDIEIVKNLKNISNDFKYIFLDKNKDNSEEKDKNEQKPNLNLNIGKITNIFKYFLDLIFKYVKKDIIKYQIKPEDKKSVYKLEDKDMVIKKVYLSNAIRIFITLVLYREKEKDKDIKIKANKKNIIDYLKNKDLWESDLYNNYSRFEEDLAKIKGLNIKIREILFFYNYLIGDKDEGFEDEVVKRIKKREEEIKIQKERERQIAMEQANQNGEEPDEDIDDSSDDDDKKKKKKKRKSSDSDYSGDSDDDNKKKKKKKKKKKSSDSDYSGDSDDDN